ncbi:hypothetical protein ACQ4M4_21255 [Leptolyngbya sp. AN02str]|uniref:hypothetical protein n=1 Tax=Leptolyngbya sp. AN02str TaxID=3423363 RepID=UPI003D314B17
MEFDSEWNDMAGTEWLQALSLPTLDWAKPFLPFTLLPEFLLEHPEVWRSIYTSIDTRIIHPRSADYVRDGQLIDGEYGNCVRQTIVEAFHSLASLADQRVSIDLEKWVRFHFFCQESTLAMKRWRSALNRAFPSESSERNLCQVHPPLVLVPFLPEIQNLVEFGAVLQIRQTMKDAAPPPPCEQIPYERLDKCLEATLLSQAIWKGMTLRALQVIAERLNVAERLEVLKWAEAQLQMIYGRHGAAFAKQLCGDKYLQNKIPCSSYLVNKPLN